MPITLQPKPLQSCGPGKKISCWLAAGIFGISGRHGLYGFWSLPCRACNKALLPRISVSKFEGKTFRFAATWLSGYMIFVHSGVYKRENRCAHIYPATWPLLNNCSGYFDHFHLCGQWIEIIDILYSVYAYIDILEKKRERESWWVRDWACEWSPNHDRIVPVLFHTNSRLGQLVFVTTALILIWEKTKVSIISGFH